MRGGAVIMTQKFKLVFVDRVLPIQVANTLFRQECAVWNSFSFYCEILGFLDRLQRYYLWQVLIRMKVFINKKKLFD